MRAAKQNWSADLRSQRPDPGGPAVNETSGLMKGMGSGIFPGERQVERPPGTVSDRSAAHHADPLGSKAGG